MSSSIRSSRSNTRVRARSKSVGSTQRTRYADYESLKADWIRQNPHATQSEYDAAMCRIARKCRV